MNHQYIYPFKNLLGLIRTFMYNSLEKSDRDGGCSNRIPCIKSNVATISRSFCPSLLFPNNLSKQLTNLIATFHSNPSWSLKNSLKAGSVPSSPKALRGGGSFPGSIIERRFSAADIGEDDKQSCARSPSTWRSPLRIFWPSYDEMLSKDRDSNASIVYVVLWNLKTDEIAECAN